VKILLALGMRVCKMLAISVVQVKAFED